MLEEREVPSKNSDSRKEKGPSKIKQILAILVFGTIVFTMILKVFLATS
ncbi:MAG: hypothetical protein HQK50_08205 [Oligoflexia bacterium]|nr:hypothetical protein [Oligoflexia bacterium]